jgi:CheY-like chemotaxis protein
MSDKSRAENRRVLIADDDPAVVRALLVRCRKLGLEVEAAADGLQTILKATRNPPRLLILDVNMPEADGFRVCEWLLDPKRPPMDVIMLTGRADGETLVRCDSFGATYVRKGDDTWSAVKAVLAEVLEIEASALGAADTLQARADARVLTAKRNRVLLVEDDANLAGALERRLAKHGAETLRASNGVDAFRIAVREQPDVIIADYIMPEGGGHYLLWRLRSTDSTQHIPVIVITGQPLDEGAEHPLARELRGRGGAVRFFRKPLDTEALLAEVGRHCTLGDVPSGNAAPDAR